MVSSQEPFDIGHESYKVTQVDPKIVALAVDRDLKKKAWLVGMKAICLCNLKDMSYWAGLCAKAFALMLAVWIGFVAPVRAGDDEGITAYARGDYVTAWQEWRVLGEQGHRRAQFNLGILRSVGLGAPQNHSTAARWFQLAAEQGLAAAQLKLGTIYRDGRGVPENPQEAYFWFTLAVAKFPPGEEHQRAISGRDDVGARLTRVQITRTLERALNWRPAVQQKVADDLKLIAELESRALSLQRQVVTASEARLLSAPEPRPLEELSYLATGVRPEGISRR